MLRCISDNIVNVSQVCSEVRLLNTRAQTKPSWSLYKCDSDSSTADDEKKKYKCSFTGCKAKFSKNRKLINHIRRHNGERPFTCDVVGCVKSYTNSSHLRRHKKTAHETQGEYVSCHHEGCEEKFSNKSNLKRHVNRKHNIKRFPFTCSKCCMGFTKKNRLLKHEYIHTGKPAFRCDVCDTYFTDEYNCNKHKRHHKLYTCSCGKQFGVWSILLQHKKSCETELTCKVCSKIFANKANLRSHYFTHDDEKRAEYICGHENCSKKYQFKKNLLQHIRTTHMGNSRFICSTDGCNRDFKSELCLKRHLKLHQKPQIIKVGCRKPRKSRSDKGKPTKSMASILSGIDLTYEEHRSIIGGQTIDIPGSVGSSLGEANLEYHTVRSEINEPGCTVGKTKASNQRDNNLATCKDTLVLNCEDEISHKYSKYSLYNNEELLLECCDQTLSAIEQRLQNNSVITLTS